MKKPSKSEEEFIKRQEAHLKEKEAIERLRREREERRRLHWMKCPKCGADLKTELYQTVEVDRCTECGGVWLDEGELEALAGKEPGFLEDFFDFFKRDRPFLKTGRED